MRDVFVSNFQDATISARLREKSDLDNEQLLDLVVTLLNCKNGSLARQTKVDALLVEQGFNAPFAVNAAPPTNNVPTNDTARENRLEQQFQLEIINLLKPQYRRQPRPQQSSYTYQRWP